MTRSRYEEYLICEQRGHVESGVRTASVPPQSICARCGAHWWYEQVYHESNVPKPDDSNTGSEPS